MQAFFTINFLKFNFSHSKDDFLIKIWQNSLWPPPPLATGQPEQAGSPGFVPQSTVGPLTDMRQLMQKGKKQMTLVHLLECDQL